MLIALILFFIGLILLVYSADRLVFGATAIANTLKIRRFTVGLMTLGIGTSLPELAFSIIAGLNGKTDMIVGNALGSNTTNILLILGIIALIRPLNIRSLRLKREATILFVLSLLVGLLLYDKRLSQTDGIILLVFFLVFAWLILTLNKRHFRQPEDALSVMQEAETPKEISQTVAFLWIIIGLIILPISAKIMVDNATVIARYLGLSELIISLTIVAIGTSLPELATAISGIYRREDDIVLGNIIGSNIFNILVVIGIPALLSPGNFSEEAFQRDYWVMLVACLVLTVLCVSRRRRLTRLLGGGLLTGFIFYIGILIYSAYI